MSEKVIVWGFGAEYDRFSKWLEPEVRKGNMKIEAILLNEENLLRSLDGIEVIGVEELLVREYDYLINMNQTDPALVANILNMLKIPSWKVIPIKVFGLPCFDLKRWMKVKESRISIISHNCWGGYTYNSLGMEFLSPFINMFMEPKDYFRLLNHFDFYMKLPLHYIREGYEPVLKRNYPVAGLEDVTLYFNHYTDFESASVMWEKRKERLNYENLFIEAIIDTKEELEDFLSLPYKNKIGFSTIPCREEQVIYFPILKNGYAQNKYDGNTWNFFNHMAMAGSDECRQYDILKLLNGEKDYMRAEMYGMI